MRTTCEWCGKKLDPPRRNKKYCNGTHKAEAAHARRGTPGRPQKPMQTVASDRRRPSRDGKGTYIYAVAGELAAVAEDLKPTSPESERFHQKVLAAKQRVDRKAAA